MMTSRISLAFVLLLLVPSLAHAASRVALIVGNSAYVHAGDYRTPRTTPQTWRRFSRRSDLP